MPRLRPLYPEQASGGTARTLLRGIIDRHGDAGPMVRTMAHSPALLQGYLELSRAMKRSAIPARSASGSPSRSRNGSGARSAWKLIPLRAGPPASPTPTSRSPAREQPTTLARPH
jgi:hypothetical protein